MNAGALFSSKSTEWETPQAFYDELNTEFGFTLDPCATPENAKCAKFYTAADDGLKQDWTGETVFCNPPYGRELPKWIEKCAISAGGVQRLLCSSRRGQIQKRFINSFIKKLKFGL